MCGGLHFCVDGGLLSTLNFKNKRRNPVDTGGAEHPKLKRSDAKSRQLAEVLSVICYF